MSSMAATTTTLPKAELSKVMKMVEAYLEIHESINNRALRQHSGISYDQAIQVFRYMVDQGRLIREGKNSGTKYYPVPSSFPRG